MSLRRRIFFGITAAVYAAVAVCVVIALTAGGTFGVRRVHYSEEVRGDFVVRYFGEDDAELSALTEEGAGRKRLFIPAAVGGARVSNIGMRGAMEIDGIEPMYDLSGMYGSAEDLLLAFPNLWPSRDYGYAEWEDLFPGVRRVFLFGGESGSDYGDAAVYAPYEFCGGSDGIMPANVSYRYNFAGAPTNGYYWLDDCAYGGGIEFVPPVPERAGYTFGGWYKEPGCVNEWDFDADLLPEETFAVNDDGENETIFTETALYAKWI